LFAPQRGIVLNTSRGAVLDNQALLGAQLAGLVLDVWEGEPNLLPGLLERADIGTPHIAGYSFDGKVNGTRMIYAAACRHLSLAAQWQPDLPAPAVPRLPVPQQAGEDDEDVLRRVIRQVYDIRADDRALRAAGSAGFDKLRADYPVRREFHNTQLEWRGVGESARAKLLALGFKS
jgi:erythronate-4-phosphate dehydrogenase